jgi:YjjG family noncanonical pyrimidine nucleotidase
MGMHHNFIFDLDQTLLDFHASEYKALGIVLTRHGLSFSNGIYQAFKAYNKSLWLELEKGKITRTELFTKRFQDILSRCPEDASGLDPLVVNDEFIRTMSMNGVLMDGALDFAEKVKKGIPDARIYIASNGATVNAKGRIASTGLDRYIDDLFISEEMGVTKPAAAFYEICLERIGEPKASCIMIGDSLSSDMLGAKNASIDSVWFMPSGNIAEAMKEYSITYCASSFDELYCVLKKWSETPAVSKATDGSIPAL